eukprot:CAMPEP_0173143998 /NCGR_PEP_ID=MMETSP1105-20130129/6987_1 /TAXON_ID=2985 /ORGANISM="Ochromonas sp., Strain BG-1" /LENGTH=372 /DNA_ID=CAMNT_0014057627 /DNA_START=227 /DNA_END=1346 /DNA_ORIENTATION=+
MSSFAVKKNNVPETVTGEAGTAKRNIIRRGGGGGKGRKDGLAGGSVDDGSLYDDPYALDEHDPNYDSEEDGVRQVIPTKAPLHRDEIARSKLTLTSYKKKIQPIIQEFLTSYVVEDVVESLQEIAAPEYSYEFVKRLINTAIDRTDHEREQVSRLLSTLYPDVLSSNMIGKGFERLFEIIDEIELDAPLAKIAVVDEVLPPAFLSDSVVSNLGGEIVDQARLLLSRDHGGAKLEKIWGPGDGRPVEEMKVAVDQLLLEYILSSDLDEAIRCLTELNASQFFHEVVKRAVVLGMEKTEEQRKALSELFAELAGIQLMAQSQAEKGFNRLYESLPDLTLDTPNASQILEDFVSRAVKDKVVSANYKKPQTSASA